MGTRNGYGASVLDGCVGGSFGMIGVQQYIVII